MSGKDYKKLYQAQDKILNALKSVLSNFYLTGGTALGRFFLNHRFSEDLDFFINKDELFSSKIREIEKTINKNFSIQIEESFIYDDFARFYIKVEHVLLKTEFINDVQYRCGEPISYLFGLIDTPLNILTNKLTAIVSREEPKDVFDIYTMATHYQFNWMEIFNESKKKAIINEIDVSQRIFEFPVKWFEEVNWLFKSPDLKKIKKGLQTIANDFIAGSDNSLSKKGSIKIEDAVLVI